MIRPLVIAPAPILVKRGRKPVSTHVIKEVSRDLVDTINSIPRAVGLAANQIGFPWRMIAIKEFSPSTGIETGKVLVIVNPEVISASDEKKEEVEECLSLPNLYVAVTRPVQVTIKGKSVGGKNLKLEESGFMARVLQHEIDHCEGRLISDYLKEDVNEVL